MSPYDVTRLSPSAPLRDIAAGKERGIVRSGAQQAQAAPQAGVTVSTEARISAGSPRIDAERVSEIRNALRDGSYPIVPAKITDAIIAARLMLSGGQ
ncbi:flagellar biosynthesis anti-sigma factor FlgM [Erythrobacter sp. EC-HK427]|uniref:flagellar biosynthesis anti-sigma factor FlgM n=1 Tax=Erythrobacter sp. EC-HK427 TaxID=2038396 RepID=UPI001255BA97|nr:flagellar biosynthesis anti-sigma factor FlgM [Erythrobacter sp. EC-HK427]VVT01525.1 conserved hypothetical protein [Erythrobacter sp. EC-HK427]